jgi:hypothetical protein
VDTSNGLQLQHLESSIEPEPTHYMQHQQSLAKILSPCRYQHGVSRNEQNRAKRPPHGTALTGEPGLALKGSPTIAHGPKGVPGMPAVV